MITDKDIILKVKKYKYVSFDIFDTLLKRNVEKPTDIFRYVEKSCIKKYGLSYKGFSKERIDAEKEIRKSNEEVTINDIYKKLGKKYPINDLKNILKEELKLEYKFSTVNLLIKKVFDYCKKSNKKIEIISDIYIPKAHIEKMLRKNGIDGWDNLFISSEFNKTKATGSLYDVVIKKLKVSPNNIIHIGDNKLSDYKNAQKKGFATIYIKTFYNHLKYYNRPVVNLNDKSVRSFLNNNILNIPQDERLGFETMGPLLYGFCMWLSNELEKKNTKNVFFFSRDGWIMKKAFDIVKKSNIKSHYFFASRRSLQVPALAFKQVTYQDYIRRLHWPNKINLRYYIKSLGVEDDIFLEKICQKYNVDKNFYVKKDKLANSTLFEKIFNNEPVFRENARKEYANLKGYINQENLCGDVAMIDIGWHGNMQKNLVDILDLSEIKNNIKGYYIGVSPDENHKDTLKMEGYMFDENKNSDMYDIHHTIISPFEQIFMAPHGSVKKYKLVNGKYQPVLYDYEQDDESSIELLRNYQNGALKFIKLINKDLYEIKVTSHFASYGVLLQFVRPYYTDAIAWGRIQFKDNKITQLIKEENVNYIFHPVKFLENYKSSYWKAGFLKENLKLNINYYRMMRNISNLIRKSKALRKINNRISGSS